jgi:hypothetical protein
MEVDYTSFHWQEHDPIFLSEKYLRSTGYPYGWIAGKSKNKEQYIMPFTTHKRNIFKAIRFHYLGVVTGKSHDKEDELDFLNSVINFFQQEGYDSVLQSPAYGITSIPPRGSTFAPFGAVTIDLCPPEETLWQNIHRHHKRAIERSQKQGIVVKRGHDEASVAEAILSKSTKNNRLQISPGNYYYDQIESLGNHAEVFVGYVNKEPTGCIIVLFSKFGAFCLHAGGADTHVLHWEAMKYFKSLDVASYIIVGSRINPTKNSKQYHLREFKMRFGATMKSGFIWKYELSQPRAFIRNMFAYITNPKGDIIDRELRKEYS